jgi:hypothetical protein
MPGRVNAAPARYPRAGRAVVAWLVRLLNDVAWPPASDVWLKESNR